jgi:hypothetical protein
MHNVTIGGEMRGGDGQLSGYLRGVETVGNVKIAGRLLGGSQFATGLVLSTGVMGNVTIGGYVQGGPGDRSGGIHVFRALGNVKIGGDLLGGSGYESGYIHGASSIGTINIGGDVVGASITGTAALTDSGLIFSFGRIASVTIGKSLTAGTDTSTGALTHSGAIVAESIGPVKIGVGIVGNATNAALITAKGLATKPAAGFDLAIASLTVGGDVRFARILAGFDNNEAPANADAAIGIVSVGANWVASDLVAGAQDKGATGFGVGDTSQTVNNTGLIARIASIAIKGVVQGTVAGGDHFGFVAEQIGKLSVGGKAIALTTGPGNDDVLIPSSLDVRLLEVTTPPI